MLRTLLPSTRPARTALLASVSVHAGVLAGLGGLWLHASASASPPRPQIAFAERVARPSVRERPPLVLVQDERIEAELHALPAVLAADPRLPLAAVELPQQLQPWMFRVPASPPPSSALPAEPASPGQLPVAMHPSPPARPAAATPPPFEPAQLAATAPPEPHYPRAARRRGWQGVTRVRVQVTAEGRVRSLAIEEGSGHDVLDEAALASVRTWRFKPARRAGVAVPDELVVPVRFQIAGPR